MSRDEAVNQHFHEADYLEASYSYEPLVYSKVWKKSIPITDHTIKNLASTFNTKHTALAFHTWATATHICQLMVWY